MYNMNFSLVFGTLLGDRTSLKRAVHTKKETVMGDFFFLRCAVSVGFCWTLLLFSRIRRVQAIMCISIINLTDFSKDHSRHN